MSICPYVISYIHIYIHTSLHIHTYSHVGIFFCSSFHLEFQYMSSDCPCGLGQVAAQDDLNSVSSATPSPSGDYPGAGRRKSPFFIGKSTHKIAIFNSYVSLPEGIPLNSKSLRLLRLSPVFWGSLILGSIIFPAGSSFPSKKLGIIPHWTWQKIPECVI